MQVIGTEPGHALCEGRGHRRRVRTALVGEPAPGDWLLVFLDNAQERLGADRVREINATLDLLFALRQSPAPAPFELPSQMSREQLEKFTS